MKTKTQTPGPYPLTVVKGDLGKFYIVTNQGNHYANTYDPSACRLISAAPDLLSAAKDYMDRVVALYGESPNMDRVRDTLRAAIARAEGGKS